MTWNGREFIDAADHGRELQSASSFDCDKLGNSEPFNPTEAGSRRDGAGRKSTSRLLKISAVGKALETRTQMAFWLPPGEKSGGILAKNTTELSEHILAKRVRIGFREQPNVISYDVTFTLPPNEPHTFAQFEALTGYMPASFEKFWKFDPAKGELEGLADGPGEQPFPVVLATAGGTHAMGIFASADGQAAGCTGPGYGRFRFVREKVVKWNCVFRKRDTERGIGAGDYMFRMFVIVGDLAMVRDSLRALAPVVMPVTKTLR